MATIPFPPGFVWGTATASYQIEGATREDGRGESIWDRFSSTPGHVLNDETGEPACDSYHRFADDIALMRAMGVTGYRFSTAWPRIVPQGTGAVNPAGLDYYDRLVDALLAAKVTPFVTLYHWDLPQALQDRGGWGSRATIDAYVRYAEIVVRRLGDRVKHWMTHNEPLCTAFLGHETGEHAPGLHDRPLALQVAHHLLVSHGAAVPVIRQHCPGAQVGIVLNLSPVYPMLDSDADRAMAQRRHAQADLWFLDPLAGRGYPRLAWEACGAAAPHILPGDLASIATPCDFLGVNYYSPTVCHDPAGGEDHPLLHAPDAAVVTARGWEIYPQGLYDLLTWLAKEYAFPNLFITENGAAYDDVLTDDGRVHDPLRQAYIRQHLEMLARAIAAGAPVRGYFCWTLLDNFEWAFGTSSRFGLSYTNFVTQQRTLKDSGIWFGRVARANALVE